MPSGHRWRSSVILLFQDSASLIPDFSTSDLFSVFTAHSGGCTYDFWENSSVASQIFSNNNYSDTFHIVLPITVRPCCE